MMMDITRILNLQEQAVIQWHSSPVAISETEAPFTHIQENTQWNFQLWHEEDIARIKDIEANRIVLAKRNIDQYNQARNNAMEKIDEWILSWLHAQQITPGAALHSETPGMMIDRLSIMTLKRYHMAEETERTDAAEEHKDKCRQKVAVLNEQIADLSNCLAEVLGKLEKGQLRFKVYRQLKMYNDPTLNPQLYNRKNSQ
ncbi:hypothetical protein HNQ91_003745 [Filimonas zeae]|uniref:DUF4254 domain-containing protein n=1 Tax=Filimonas zeae TaxID=1737353 RepID=A0A917J260_9BACT|nr:DUF4254 domain-containing protein [Filimonas zeae]MDR6340680.1 hypothetical protein [Filimonas zeae]GGH73867.1 hypothetical protein GCM10011379_35860 [Filimonas zeae]